MVSTLTDRTVGKSTFLSIAVVLLAISLTQIARAGEPDIPRMQVEAQRGSVQQEIALANAYLLGTGVVRDERQAARWYEKAANSGDPNAQEQIGFFYQAGIGVERNPVRAAEWFERAVAGGSVSAKVNLGVAYVWGIGVRKDPEFAFQLFREAAEKGSGTGACFLGDSYYLGVGVAKNVVMAVRWLEVGAKLHDPEAEFDLALLLLRRSDRADTDRAVKLLRESAGSGYVAAKHQLALVLIGDSRFASPRYAKEAVGLMEEASSEGFWKSTTVLGILYREGRGEPSDKEAAYYHFRIAILQGGQNAATLLANDIRALRSELDESRTLALDSKAVAWVQQHSHALEFVHAPVGRDRTFSGLAIEYPEGQTHAGKFSPLSENEGEDGADIALLP